MILAWWVACTAQAPCEAEDDGLGEPIAWEQALLEDGFPPSEEPFGLIGEGGLALVGRDSVPDDWTGTGPMVLLVHGSSAHGGLYSVIAEGLRTRGVYARLVDVRGHGRSVCESATSCIDPGFTDRDPIDDRTYFPGRIGDSADADQIARDLGAWVADLRSTWPEAPLVVAGHSSGAGVMSRWVEGGGAAFANAFAMLAPYNHPDQPQVRPEVLLDCPDTSGTDYARVDLGALGDALRGASHRYVLRFEKGETYTTALDVLAYTWTTVQGMATRSVEDFWRAFTKPLLVLAATEDALLDPAITAEQAALAPASRFVEIGDTSHVGVSWSDEVAEVLADFAWEQVPPE